MEYSIKRVNCCEYKVNYPKNLEPCSNKYVCILAIVPKYCNASKKSFLSKFRVEILPVSTVLVVMSLKLQKKNLFLNVNIVDEK